ncbi:MAG: trk system potassium uptake protein TrkA [Halobacteriales archaeon]
MHVIIIGAGEVGSNIAGSLADSHEVTVVDIDGDRVESLTYSLDVLAIEGDGTTMEVLQEAGIGETDLFIASTDSDEANIVACATAKALGDPFTIARVRKTDLLRTWEHAPDAFAVEFMVSTDLLTAQAIVRIARLPTARDVDSFADGTVQMAEFPVPADSPLADQTVREADRFDELTFAAILRDGGVTIPQGDARIEADDQIVVIGVPERIHDFAARLEPKNGGDRATEILIVGGGEIGYHAARLFGEGGLTPQLIERDPERARELAEDLPGTVVMESDATDVEFLTREHVDETDLVVAALGSDEKNLLVSLLAKRLGASRAVAVVENTDYVDLFETVGVDVAVNPRKLTAEEITRFTYEQETEKVAIVESDRAEVLEVEIADDGVFAGRSISEAVADLPGGIVVGALTRDGRYLTPRGDTVVEPGDHAVVFVDADVLDALNDKL